MHLHSTMLCYVNVYMIFVSINYTYTSAKGYLPLIQYVAPQISSTPYDGIVASGWATTKCTTTRKSSVPLLEKVYPYW